jgi:hypothetical protein
MAMSQEDIEDIKDRHTLAGISVVFALFMFGSLAYFIQRAISDCGEPSCHGTSRKNLDRESSQTMVR